MKTPDILVALKPVINIFEKLSIPYYIGGSIASSIYGIARATMDVDIVADMDVHHIPALTQHLENDYYIDEDMIKEAIRNKSSFNLIHLETVLKIDVFIYKDDPYQRNAIQRKLKDTLEENSDTTFYFSSPEDIIINKLIWYKMGGEISDRQWLDVIGVIKVQGESLDKSYLKDWSQKLQILELLNKAFDESGIKL
jgi:hypothetical protein